MVLLSSGEGVGGVDRSFWMVTRGFVNNSCLHCPLLVNTVPICSRPCYGIGRKVVMVARYNISLYRSKYRERAGAKDISRAY